MTTNTTNETKKQRKFEKICDNLIETFFENNKQDCSIEFFVEQAFYELNCGERFYPNWHIDALCNALMQIYLGTLKRLVITIPPRYMKTHCVSIAFSAWLLGKQPHKKIIGASYNQQLSNNFLNQVKILLSSYWYLALFPQTKISKTNGAGLKNKIVTSKNGFRFATSIAGTLTGEGADLLIADDPHKPLDIANPKSRRRVHNWFEGTFLSRLNNKKTGAIILIMQRLHEDDLVGYLQSKSSYQNWKIINFELLSTAEQTIQIGNFIYTRKANEPLHAQREGLEEINKLKEIVGDAVFSSQYQQNPISEEGGIVKKCWIETYSEALDTSPERHYFISIDAAIKASINNDFTAITIWYCVPKQRSDMQAENAKHKNDKFLLEDKILAKHEVFLQEVINQKLSYPEILKTVLDLIVKYKPQQIIIEDAASGSQLIQHLKNAISIPIAAKVPTRNKQTRLTLASVFFEKRLVKINQKMMEYYTTLAQLTNFPAVKHDDICDSISMFISWFYETYEPQLWQKKSHNFSIRSL